MSDINEGFQRTINTTESMILTQDKLNGGQLNTLKFFVIPLNIAKKNEMALGSKSITLIDRKEPSDLWPSRVSSFITKGGNKTENLKFLMESS